MSAATMDETWAEMRARVAREVSPPRRRRRNGPVTASDLIHLGTMQLEGFGKRGKGFKQVERWVDATTRTREYYRDPDVGEFVPLFSTEPRPNVEKLEFTVSRKAITDALRTTTSAPPPKPSQRDVDPYVGMTEKERGFAQRLLRMTFGR